MKHRLVPWIALVLVLAAVPLVWAADNFAVDTFGGTRTVMRSKDDGTSHTAAVINIAPLTNSSGNVANANAVSTLPAVALKTTYICGFAATSAGSTAAAVVNLTIVGLIGGTMTLTYVSVAGVTLANQPLVVPFSQCIPASAVNTAIVVTLPALGAGNTNAAVTAWGHQF